MNRAYAILDVKAVADDGEFVTVTGIASTPTTDRMGDIVEPMGSRFKTPMPLLWQHDAHKPVGHVTFAKPTKTGIPFTAKIPQIKEAGVLKDRVDEAIHSLKYRLVAAVSIGFAPVANAIERMKDGGLRFLEWDWLELSLVTIPANPEAVITGVKSFDERLRALSGEAHPVVPPLSGNRSKSPTYKGMTMKSIHEQLAELQDLRWTKKLRMEDITEKAANESRKVNAVEGSEIDGLLAEVADIDDDIRTKSVQLLQVQRATPVVQRSGPTIIVKGSDVDEKFKGQNFTRMVIAKALASLDQFQGYKPSEIAQLRWGKTNPTLVAVMKANEVPGFGSGAGEAGAALVTADSRYTGDFIEYLYNQTVYDRLGLKEVPANVTVKGQDAAATAYWVGESKAIPNTTAVFSAVNLTPLKVAAIAVLSNELIRDSSPAAESLVRDALVEAAAQRIDTTFLSASAAVAGVSPAGILNGVTATAASGIDAAALRLDLSTMLALFDTAKIYGGVTLVTTRALARKIAMMYNTLGTSQDFPGTTPMGGTLIGYPVIIGDNVPSGDIIAIASNEVWKIGDQGVTVSLSKDAMIEQSSAPTGATDTPVAASQFFTSMFQEESTAIKVVRPTNFAKRRIAAVQFISGANYG